MSLNSGLKKYYTQTEVDNIIKKNKVKSIVIEFDPRHEADAGNRNPVLASEARLRGFHIDSRRREPWQNW